MSVNRMAALALLLLTPWAAAQTPTPATTPAPAASPQVGAPAARRVPTPANYVALGTLYYDQGNYSDAYLAFRAAAEADPKNAGALLGLGRAQTKLRLYGPAIETLKKLLTLDSRNLSGALALAQAYQAQFVGSSDRSSVSGNLDAALKVLATAEGVVRSGDSAKLDIDLSKVLNERGYIYRLQNQSAQAIDAFKQASALNPDNGVILYNLGDMYYASGNLNEAVNSLQLAVIADPTDAYNRAYYAKLLALSGNTAAARPEAAQAAKLAPQNPYAQGQYGVVAYLAKDAATARNQLQAALKLDALRYPEFYYYLGRLEIDGGQLREARADLTKAVALASSNPEYLYYLGLSYERASTSVSADKMRAQDAYTRALQLRPGYALAQDGLNRVK